MRDKMESPATCVLPTKMQLPRSHGHLYRSEGSCVHKSDGSAITSSGHELLASHCQTDKFPTNEDLTSTLDEIWDRIGCYDWGRCQGSQDEPMANSSEVIGTAPEEGIIKSEHRNFRAPEMKTEHSPNGSCSEQSVVAYTSSERLGGSSSAFKANATVRSEQVFGTCSADDDRDCNWTKNYKQKSVNVFKGAIGGSSMRNCSSYQELDGTAHEELDKGQGTQGRYMSKPVVDMNSVRDSNICVTQYVKSEGVDVVYGVKAEDVMVKQEVVDFHLHIAESDCMGSSSRGLHVHVGQFPKNKEMGIDTAKSVQTKHVTCVKDREADATHGLGEERTTEKYNGDHNSRLDDKMKSRSAWITDSDSSDGDESEEEVSMPEYRRDIGGGSSKQTIRKCARDSRAVNVSTQSRHELLRLTRLCCEKCGRRFRLQKQFDIHADFHRQGMWRENKRPGSRRYTCMMCHEFFETNEKLCYHVQAHTEDLPFICGVCGAAFRASQVRSRHEISVHAKKRNLKCPHCPKMFAASASLFAHTESHKCKKYWMPHDSIYACDTCDFTCRGQREFRQHLYSHNTNGTSVKCGKCNRAFSALHHLHVHYKTCGVRDSEAHRGFLCHVCGKILKNPACGPRHMRDHMQNRPYACKHCDMSFKQSGTRDRHEVLHFKDGEYRDVMQHKRRVKKGRDGRKYV